MPFPLLSKTRSLSVPSTIKLPIVGSPSSTRFYQATRISSTPFQGEGIPTKEIPFQFRPSLQQGEKFVPNLSRGTNVTHERWKMSERGSPAALLQSISTDLMEISPRDSRCYKAVAIISRKEEKEEKTRRGFSKFCVDLEFRSPFVCLPRFCGDEERGRVIITGGWIERDQRRSNNKQE